jgi:DNA-binding CsgD family transcriptional regulator
LQTSALTWLALDDQPRIMIGRHLGLLWTNAAAETLLAGRFGLEVKGGALLTTDPSKQDALNAFVLAVGPGQSTWCLPCTDDEHWLLFRARRFGGPDAPIVGLSLVASETFQGHYHDLDTAFGLTNAEHRVLKDLLGGNDAGALSKLHRVSMETTRSHIRSIYAKLGVGSRERLFFKVQAFRG